MVNANPLVVVIADDSLDNADSTGMVVAEWGYKAHVCHFNQFVIECCLTFPPDVVLLDIGFPRVQDGLDLVAEIRKEPLLKDAVLIAITGYGNAEMRERAMNAGFDLFFSKPMNLKVLEEILKDLQEKKDSSVHACQNKTPAVTRA